MAEDTALVGLGVQPIDMMGKMSQLLQIKQQQQALAGQQAQVQQEQQSARQRAALAQYKWGTLLDDRGFVSIDKALDPQYGLADAAGDQFPDILQGLQASRAGQIGAQKSLFDLNEDQRVAVGQMIAPLFTDPDINADPKDPEFKEKNDRAKQKLNAALIQLHDTHGDSILPAISAYSKPLKNAPPGGLPDQLRAMLLQTEDASKQVALQQPTLVNAGDRLEDVNPITKGRSKDIRLGIAPGMSTMIDPRTGNPLAINQQSGAIGNLGEGFPGAPPSQAPQHWSQASPTRPAGMPAPFVPGQKEATETQAAGVATRAKDAQEKADSSAQAIDSLSRARTILDGNIDTGGGFEAITKMKNALSGIAGFDNAGTDANSLVKNLARYQASRATSVGLGNTDAARELAEKGSPNTKINKDALKGIVTQSLAVEQALLGFAKIQTASNDPQQLIANEREFRSTPHLIQAYEYGLARTPEEAEEFLKHHNLDADDIGKSRAKLKKLGAL
jgi:hypothetical protein